MTKSNDEGMPNDETTKLRLQTFAIRFGIWFPTFGICRGDCTMPYPAIDPRRLQVFPLRERRNLLRAADELSKSLAVDRPSDAAVDDQIGRLAQRILAARERGSAVMLAYGAHLIKNGAGPLINRLIEAGLVSHLATQGAGIIHDWEFAFQGESGESVRENAPAGRFGAWDETGRWLNLAVLVGAAEGLGIGEAVGRLIAEDQFAIPAAEQLRREIAADPGHPLSAAKADLLWTIETLSDPQRHASRRASPQRIFRPRRGLSPSGAFHRASGHRLRHHRQPSAVPRRRDGASRHDRRANLCGIGRPARRRGLPVGRIGHHEPAGVRKGLQRGQ